MWVEVKELAAALDISTRAVQKRITSGDIEARRKNGRTYEVDTASLPAKWASKLPASMKGELSPVAPLTKPTPDNAMVSSAVTAAIGRPLSGRERESIQVYQHWLGQKAIYARKTDRIQATASFFGISESKVRRIISQIEECGVIIAPRKDRESTAWSPEAITFLKSCYLQILHDSNIDSKAAAIKKTNEEAQKRGWKVGCRASAYNILSTIPALVMEYATGGDRALDNIFYIRRDWSLLKPAQILIGDQHRVDFWVKEQKADGSWRYYRPEFYVWEDAASRCVAGIAVAENYSSDTVKEALHMATRRFGLFDCTYNDNGSSECSEVVTEIIDELIALSGGKSRMLDVSELYRTKDNLYVVEDDEGNVVDTATSVEAWRKKHRRIYANVKNAKAKPIERLFNTLETMLSEAGIPGHVVDPAAPAHVEEKQSLSLEKQKEADEILTMEEFLFAMVDTINRYEHKKHSQLGMTPFQFVEKAIAEGWRADVPDNPADLDFIFLERRKVRVVKGRVTVNKVQYMGQDIRSDGKGGIEDVGLHLHEGEKVEVRFDPLSPSRAYAVIPGTASPVRALTPVEAIEMLDEEAMQERIRWKRHSMKVVREAFKAVAYPESETFRTAIASQVEEADRPVVEEEERRSLEKIRKMVESRDEPRRTKNVLHFFASTKERFRWCLEELTEGRQLGAEDLRFVQEYRTSDEYAQDREYWATYERFGGLR